MRIKFKLDSVDPNIISVFEAGLVSKEYYNNKWCITYASMDCKKFYQIATIVPEERHADYIIKMILEKGYADVSDYKSVEIADLLNEVK